MPAVLRTLRRELPGWNAPIVTFVAMQTRDPFRVLIACLLSLRTKDDTTGPAAERLFALADTPADMLCLSPAQVEQVIYPVGFYRTKGRTILNICRVLMTEHGGRVPADMEALLALKGVGRKTANLVLAQGFGRPAICVDTHVHRISNRWGYVRTRTPEQTETTLRERLPRRYWIEYNDLLVAFGQTICKPTSPLCERGCPVKGHCPRIGVTRHR
jgi:endonuclease-3